MKDGHSGKLLRWANRRGERLEEALPKLIEGSESVLDVAKEIGVQPRSIYHWLRTNNLVIKRKVVPVVEGEHVSVPSV